MLNKLQFTPVIGFNADYKAPERIEDKKNFLFNSPLVRIRTTEKVDSFVRTGKSLLDEESDQLKKSLLATKLAHRLADIQNVHGAPDDVKMLAMKEAYNFEKGRANRLERYILRQEIKS